VGPQVKPTHCFSDDITEARGGAVCLFQSLEAVLPFFATRLDVRGLALRFRFLTGCENHQRLELLPYSELGS